MILKVTKENINTFDCIEQEDYKLLLSLIEDVDEYNKIAEEKGHAELKKYISVQTHHDQYSEERTDPCPDYYGMYRLHYVDDPHETICLEMTIDELDMALCVFDDLIEKINPK